jgi:hypothetical protein
MVTLIMPKTIQEFLGGQKANEAFICAGLLKLMHPYILSRVVAAG